MKASKDRDAGAKKKTPPRGYETAFCAQLCADRIRSARGQRVVANDEGTEEGLAAEVVALTLSGVDEAAARYIDDLVVHRSDG